MADIFNTQGNKATQAVIDAASKILMGVNDSETAKAQTEEEHPAIDPKNQELGEAKKKAKKAFALRLLQLISLNCMKGQGELSAAIAAASAASLARLL